LEKEHRAMVPYVHLIGAGFSCSVNSVVNLSLGDGA
jgi:hypothetical protein